MKLLTIRITISQMIEKDDGSEKMFPTAITMIMIMTKMLGILL